MRWARHAGRAGRRIVLRLARAAAGNAPGPGEAARRLRKSGRLRGAVVLWKGFCYVLGTAVLAALAVQLWFLGHIVYWNFFNPSSTAFMERQLEALRAGNRPARLRREWLPYA